MIALTNEQRRTLADAVAAAGKMPDALVAIDALYRRVQQEIDARQPLCQVSGKCCHFDRYGHRLFVTPLELASFTTRLPAGPANNAANPGGCRFQQGLRCAVHSIRPFGCRIFFCDPSAQAWQNDQYERFHREIRMLHDRFGIPYLYVEWREALAAVIGPD